MSAIVLWTVATLVLACSWTWKLLWEKWCLSRSLEKALQRQGIRGPPRNPLTGGTLVEVMKLRHSRREKDLELSHEILDHIMPDYCVFSKEYGIPYVFWWGNEPRVTVKDPEIIRELLSKKADYFGKSSGQQAALVRLLGYGLIAADGEEWAHHRRVVAPAFRLEKLKDMTGIFVDCTSRMLDKWEQLVKDSHAEIDVNEEFSVMTADIISHTAFGSSYQKGKRVFEVLNSITKLVSKVAYNDWLPFNRLIPTKLNRDLWKLQTELDNLLLNIVQGRKDAVKHGRCSTYGDDLLGLMLAESDGSKNIPSFDNRRLIGECKTFYVAGHETTATLLTWTIFLLALNPEWQDRARAEVLEVCKDESLNTDMLGKLKQVGMILNETLRLYPPASMLIRGCFRDVKLGDLYIPKGVAIHVPILAVHLDKDLWGADAHKFNPERFLHGVSKACKHPNAFLPFSLGPRVCVGQNFALMESKIGLAMLLRRFAFSLSPSYRHCPTIKVTVKPHHGMQIIFKQL